MTWYFITPLHSYRLQPVKPGRPFQAMPWRLLDALTSQKVQLTLTSGDSLQDPIGYGTAERKIQNSCGRLLGESRPLRADPIRGSGEGWGIGSAIAYLDAPSWAKVQRLNRTTTDPRRSADPKRSPGLGVVKQAEPPGGFAPGGFAQSNAQSAQSASGLGRTWMCTTIGRSPLPPSLSHGVRSPSADHNPLPFQPALGLSMRASRPLA